MKLLFVSALLVAPTFAQECSTTWKCFHTNTPPSLDGAMDDWANVEAYTTTLMNTAGQTYDAGTVSYKCLHDSENIFLAMEIPGEYSFDSSDNHHCAAIATMMKIGSAATYVNMGGCPDAMGGCANGVPDTCSDYRVDIGAHWELSGTNQTTLYGLASNPTSKQGGTGDDIIANNDDEYAVSPYCRFDDDDDKAGNEWSGAWSHTNPTQGEFGNYIFEVSRTLTTSSTITDAQLAVGDTIQFGLAFWDPFEIEGSGWSDIGHYVTGCAAKWIDLELVPEGQEGTTEDIGEAASETIDAAADTGSGAACFGAHVAVFLAAVTALF